MITPRSSQFMIIALSAFILTEVIPLEVLAFRGMRGLVEAAVRAGIAQRPMRTATKEPPTRPSKRSKSPVSPEKKPVNKTNLTSNFPKDFSL